MKAIMYHYVRPHSTDLPYFRFLDLADFRRQLDWFEENFRFATREEFLASFRGETVPQGAVVLTFDDGVIDHHDHVVPELVSRGLWGIFYVPSGPYSRGKLLDVHRIHLLLGRYGGAKMVELFRAFVTDEMLTHDRVHEYRALTYPGQEEAESSTLFKRMMNYFISYDWRTKILDRMMEELLGDETAQFKKFYVSAAQLASMQRAGMVIGSHSVSHPVMARLSPEDQRREIEESFQFLDAATGPLSPRTFCYPYGGSYTYTDETEKLLTSKKMRLAKTFPPMACAKPVLFSGEGESASLILDNACGLVSTPEDARALADNMLRLADDPALALRLGQNALNFLKTELDWTLIVKRWLSEIVKPPATPPASYPATDIPNHIPA